MASANPQNANTALELDQASPTRTCCVCGHSRFRLLHHWDPAHLRNVATIPVAFWACECGIALLDPVPTAQQLPETGDWWSPHRKEIYRNVWFKHIRIRIQNSLFGNARSRLIRQTQKVMPSGRLLDIGCGTGSLLKEASKFYDCTGLEPSDRAADAAESAGFQVIRSTVENAQIPDDAFDVVTMDAVLEHVPDPVAVLQQIHRILRPGGIVVIKVPKLWGPSHRRHGREWNGFRVGYHLTMFTGKTLSAALEVAGFAPLSQPSRDRWLDDILVLWGRQQPVSSTRTSAA